MEIEKIIFYPKYPWQFWKKREIKFKQENNNKIIFDEPVTLKPGESITCIYKITLELSE